MESTRTPDLGNTAMIATFAQLTETLKAKATTEDLINRMTDFYAYVTEAGEILSGNREAAKWLSVSEEDLIYRPISELFDVSTWESVQSRILSHDFRESALACTLVTKDGRQISCSFNEVKSISRRRGPVFQLIARDVTELLEERHAKSRLEAELEAAQVVQNEFLPPPRIQTHASLILSHYRGAEHCSGDWWGHFELSPTRELVCIADVTGHGTSSAMVTSMIHGICLNFSLRSRSEPGSEHLFTPASLLSEVNKTLNLSFRGKKLATMLCLMIDRATSTLHYCIGGHHNPIMIPTGEQRTAKELWSRPQNDILGDSYDNTYTDNETTFAVGDRIVLYTDGILDGRSADGQSYGNRFKRTIREYVDLPFETFFRSVLDRANSFYGTTPLPDDITFIAFEIQKSQD